MRSLSETSSNPFESVQFRRKATQPAPSDRLTIEKQKALSRYRPMVRHADRESLLRSSKDDGGIQQIQEVFDLLDLRLSSHPAAFSASLASSAASPSTPDDTGANAQYIRQRGEFEFRVASGNIEYVPTLEMTIFTSNPDIDFGYTGNFYYILPAEDIQGSSLNLKI